jgi:hypothetical protein
LHLRTTAEEGVAKGQIDGRDVRKEIMGSIKKGVPKYVSACVGV